MTTSEAIRIAYKLQEVWVGKPKDVNRPFEWDRIHASISQELEWNRQRPARCSEGNKRETRYAAIQLGKVHKQLGNT